MKPNRLDLMIDIETLGKTDKPLMIQLAAVPFNVRTGEVYPETFDMLISPQSGVKAGLKSEASVVDWWLSQEQAVIQKVVAKSMLEGRDLKEVLTAFSEYVAMLKKKYNVRVIKVFVNGCLDWPTIQSNYAAVHLEEPVAFWDVNDIRVLVDQGFDRHGINPKKDTPFVGEKHNALDDCRQQIKYTCVLWNYDGKESK